MTEINIQAAQQYITEKKDGISGSAQIALNALEKALSDDIHDTESSLMDLAHAVERAQSWNETKRFIAQEFGALLRPADQAPENNETLPHNATAEYIVEKAYETGNEVLIDGTRLLLTTLEQSLSVFSLTLREKENLKIGMLGYIFDHYYEALGGLKISDLQNIFTDATKALGDVSKLTKGSITEKIDAGSQLLSGGTGVFDKISGILGNTGKIEDAVSKHMSEKFWLLMQLLSEHRKTGTVIPPEGDTLSWFLSDPENIINFEKRFPAKSVEELTTQVQSAPKLPDSHGAEMAGKLKRVFENKTAILDTVTGTGKKFLDTVADAPEWSPLSWVRDIVKSVLSFFGWLPFIGKFVKHLLGLDPTEEVDAYFSPEKRFQRLSTQSLQSLGANKDSILSWKMVTAITPKSIAVFTKAYMPLSTEKEQKETGISPETWFQITHKHEIPVIREWKQIIVQIPPEDPTGKPLHISESDFDSGLRPRDSFFAKINALWDLLSTPPVPPTTSTQTPDTGTKAPEPQPEKLSKEALAERVITLGKTLLEQSRAEVAKLEGVNKTLAETILQSISTALESKSIEQLKASLVPVQSQEDKLNPAQKKSLRDLLSLISEWEKASSTPLTPSAIPPEANWGTKKPEPEPAKETPKEASWADKLKAWIDTFSTLLASFKTKK